MPTPGGYGVTYGMYRVPDLLTEEQFKQYMLDTYGVEVSFKYFDNEGNEVEESAYPNPNRALGESTVLAPALMVDTNATDEQVGQMMRGVDPVLRAINEANVPASYDTTPTDSRPREEESEEEETVDESSVYSDWSKAELEAECERRGLSKSGTKADLAARLEADDAGD
jgi:SAP domain